jgi:MoxR-like ATPase
MATFFASFVALVAARFIKSERLVRALALALVSGRNLLLWGPGGHGKSEATQFALRLIRRRPEDCFVQSFGEGMTEDRLWGGVDLQVLDRENLVRYRTDDSFLAARLAVFEELFDAPPVVLLSLKDAVQARELRNGAQRVKMTTEVIFALTNKEPTEVGDLGPSAQALLERFPLQLRVAWESYSSQDYAHLFRTVGAWADAPEPAAGGLADQLEATRALYKRVSLNGQERILAELIAKAGEKGQPISPRSAAHATAIVRAAAALRGSDKVEKQDLLDLAYLPGMEAIAAELGKEVEAAVARAEAERLLQAAEAKLAALLTELAAADSPIKALQVYRRLQAFGDEVAALRVTDALTERRKKLREAADGRAQEALAKAVSTTRI